MGYSCVGGNKDRSEHSTEGGDQEILYSIPYERGRCLEDERNVAREKLGQLARKRSGAGSRFYAGLRGSLSIHFADVSRLRGWLYGSILDKIC